jgi:hypothetical protein
MRFPWSDPSREEVEAVAHDLIVRHSLKAYEEAVHLSEVARSLGSSKNDELYRLAADEIKLSFDEAWKSVCTGRIDEPQSYLSKLNQSEFIRSPTD